MRGVACDVADPDSVEHAAQAAFAAFGKVARRLQQCRRRRRRRHRQHLARQLAMGARRQPDGRAARHQQPSFRISAPMARAATSSTPRRWPACRPASDLARMRRASLRWSRCRRGWQAQLKPLGIGVTVLCPGFRAHAHRRQRAQSWRSATARRRRRIPQARRARWPRRSPEYGCNQGSTRRRSLRQALTAIRDNELYVFTHPDMRGEVDERFAAIQAALDKATAVNPKSPVPVHSRLFPPRKRR